MPDNSSGVLASKPNCQVDQIVPVGVVGQPSPVEHDRRPPAARNLPAIRRHRIGEADHGVAAVDGRQVTDIDVGARNRRHPNQLRAGAYDGLLAAVGPGR
jgi:hypothetical protein